MKRVDSKKERPRIVWDEVNLEENERIKAQLNATKITEPKTPYHGPQHEEEAMDDDMKPLQLDEGAAMEPLDLPSASNGVLPDALPHTSGPFSEDSHGQDYFGRPSAGSSFSSDQDGCNSTGNSGDEGASENQVKRRRFEAHRKAHYNMRAALQKAKSLDDVAAEAAGGGDVNGAAAALAAAAAGNAAAAASGGGQDVSMGDAPGGSGGT